MENDNTIDTNKATQLLLEVAIEKLEKLRNSRRIVPLQQIATAIKIANELKQLGDGADKNSDFFKYIDENRSNKKQQSG